ncbi:uncharacterized protein LOC122403866 [Colletes gigas]|uniref:uncharacterized protein LOC122403866 n=1 Tax=Colletes gigas TaxID=935657 RepID=UPI001C9B34E3|nr:uncharacterized protein LOC122403866 [Colletes gigas]
MESHLKPLIAERRTVKAKLTILKNFVQTAANETDVLALERRLSVNEKLHEKFDDVQTRIETIVIGTNLEELHLNEREVFESTYFNTMASLERLIQNLRGPARPNTLHTPSPIISETVTPRLPTITLLTFSGDFDNWLRFRDTFESLIHNKEGLTDIQKFHYLTSALKGPAARMISSLGVSEANYKFAWHSLKNRYEDSQALTIHHADALIDLPPIRKPSGIVIREFIDTVNNHILALEALGLPVKTWDLLVVLILTKKLDPASRVEWEKRAVRSQNTPTLREFIDILEERSRLLERTKPVASLPSSSGSELNKIKPRNQFHVSSHVASTLIQCVVCKGEHTLFQCKEFRSMPQAKMHETIKRLQCCFNCLQTGHSARTRTRGVCKKCGGKHNTLLHRDYSTSTSNFVYSSSTPAPSKESSSQNSIVEPTIQSCLANSQGTAVDYTVLSTALVHVEDMHGNKHECYALLDVGSQAHFISENLCNKLKLSQTRINAMTSGLGMITNPVKSKTQIVMHSRTGSFKSNLECLVIQKITDNMPSVPLDRRAISIPTGIPIADPRFNESKEIDLLIGAALFWQLLCVGQHKANAGLVWQKTRLGWVLGGHLRWPRDNPTIDIRTFHTIKLDRLDNAITKFWKIEDNVSIQNNQIAIDDSETHFQRNTTRDANGKYIVSIPFNDKIGKLGTSREQAEKRLLAMERKFARNPTLRSQYNQFMLEYEQLGHMSRFIDSTNTLDSGYFLPHHAVFKETSTTTKLRVVFDGSAKTSSGISLNETQLVGPTVQSDLFSILLRFRKHNIILSADIEKMYRQVLVKREDRRFQRILWRFNREDSISTFELNTITYGTVSAPFLATRTLTRVDQEHLDTFPITAHTIINDFDLDDLLTGCETVTDAQQLHRELTDMLGQAGFPLRKWACNHRDVLTGLTDETRQEIRFDTSDHDQKTLGLLWSTTTDERWYTFKSHSQTPVTKRAILSRIAQIFDPLGLIGPVIVRAKLIMQQLWQLQLGWDETLPQGLHTQWSTFHSELHQVISCKVQRRVLCSNAKRVELHGFADASERAYGACIYIRTLMENDTWFVRLLCAKSRVAPLKTISLPRLELCAALLLSRLADKVKRALELNFNCEQYWSDSTITLAWIKGPSSRWKTFVANRTSEIQLTSTKNWNHVNSEQNPADVLSRGSSPSDLSTNHLWWFGPKWLTEEVDQWPASDIFVQHPPEERQPSVTCYNILNKSHSDLDDIFLKYFSYCRLRRIVAYCLRFINRLKLVIRKPQSGKNGDDLPYNNLFLSTKELVESEYSLVRLAQLREFADEIKILISNKKLSSTNRLISLNPFLDNFGVLRVGGRLINAPMPYNQKHPMILPYKHPLSTLIVVYEHQRLLHAGCQHTLASLRSRFWPISGKRLVKKVIHDCVPCFKVNPIGTRYIMGNLPAARVTPARAFATCGIDYAGPVVIKERGRGRISHKTYICLFVCFATKAIHIELAIDFTTDAFLNCLYRFISRRGRSQCIYSDNGTNFIGARNELNELGILLNSQPHNDRVRTALSQEQIQWHLIPPYSPHFGGLWERAIKSVKTHLKIVIGTQQLTYEELYTILAQIEACLNSRPLHPLSNDPNDLTPLTPGHFLIGEPLNALPQPDLLHLNQNRLNRYQLIQQMTQHFWKRWQRDYLTELQQRCKWKTDSPNAISEGMMVLIRDDNLPPLRWKLGRITELHKGTDGVVRVASVKTSDGIIKRPIVKLCFLPITSIHT